MKHPLPLLFSLPLLFLFNACASPSSTLVGMYASLHEDVSAPNPDTHDREQFASRQETRIKRVHKLIDAKQVVSAQDYLWASVILVESDSMEELRNSYSLALEAARLGEDRGFRVAAESCDKQLVKQGMHQRYGTQYMWEPVLEAWRLYPLDPRTTDVERQAMGVEPLEELKKKEAVLNARMHKGT
jgi:hypothetical protein